MADGSNLLRMLEPAVRPSGSPAPQVRGRGPIEQRGFDEVLAEMRHQPVTLSDGAQRSLADRGIRLDAAQQAALNEAANRAAEAGGQRTLMLMRNTGLIMDVPERTVREVVDEAGMREGAVTRIDSALRVETPDEPDSGPMRHGGTASRSPETAGPA